MSYLEEKNKIIKKRKNNNNLENTVSEIVLNFLKLILLSVKPVSFEFVI